MLLLYDRYATTMRLLYDRYAITMRLLCDRYATTVRQLTSALETVTLVVVLELLQIVAQIMRLQQHAVLNQLWGAGTRVTLRIG